MKNSIIFALTIFILELVSVFCFENGFIRNHASDIFASAYLYFLLRIFFNITRALIITASLSLLIECSQLIEKNSTIFEYRFISDVFLGSTFDVVDLVMYGCGILTALYLEQKSMKLSSNT